MPQLGSAADDALMRIQNVDAVYIATPNTNHYQNATTCLKLGKHVLLEKCLDFLWIFIP